MAYTYLSLVNDVLNELNEVVLTSATFNNAAGFYSKAKMAVNTSLFKINTQETPWPWQRTTKSLVLTIDQVRYDYETGTRAVDFRSFRIQGDTVLGNTTTKLTPINYEEYLEKYSDMEYRPTNYHDLPTNVVRDPALGFCIISPPDKAYTLDYEYYTTPSELSVYSDVPTFPEQYKHVIFNGAMIDGYRFRGDLEASKASEAIFKEELEGLRRIYINNTDYIRSTVIVRR